MSKPKLHEIIAAEPNVTATFNAMREETLKVFDKPTHFLKTVTQRSYFDAADAAKLDTIETKDIITTVRERLDYLFKRSFTNYLDIQLQKDATNQIAKADIIINGKPIAKDVPATMLLQLEKELKAIRDLLLKAPTLQPGPVWVEDAGEGLFVTQEPKITTITKKTMKPVVLVEATDKFPAQVEKVNEDVAIAKVSERVWSGMLTSTVKAEILDRVDTLLVAAKKARQRANGTEVVQGKIGSLIAEFILNGPDTVEAD